MATHHPQNKQFWLAGSAVAVIALLFGLWTFHQNGSNKKIELQDGTILPIPHDISPFHLVSADDKPFTNANLKGHWSVLFFGFTRCPQLCPTTLSTLNNMYTTLAKNKNIKELPQVVFISVDPDRDNPKQIKKYLASFNKNFIGATGTKENIKKLTKEFSILFTKVNKPNAKDANDYVIDHSGTLLLVNPEVKLFAVFSTPHDAVKLSQDLLTIEENFHA